MKSTKKTNSKSSDKTKQSAIEQEKTLTETIEKKLNTLTENNQETTLDGTQDQQALDKTEETITAHRTQGAETIELKVDTPTQADDAPQPIIINTTSSAPPTAPFKLLTILALLLAGGAVTFSAYMWQHVSLLEQPAQDNTSLETNALKADLANLQEKFNALQTQLDALNQNNHQTDLIAGLLPSTISSLLTSAELHVTLSNSTQPLLNALSTIDNQLKNSGIDETHALRQAIRTDINNIRNHPSSDPIKMAADINNLIDLINQDPTLLAARVRPSVTSPEIDLSINVDLSDAPINTSPTEAESDMWGSIKDTFNWTVDKTAEFGSATWEQLSSLIEITPINEDLQQIILSQSETTVLRDNIKLRLSIARISILQGQYDQAKKELSDVQSTIQTYFANNEKTQLILEKINMLSSQLQSTSLPQPLQTLTVLRTHPSFNQ